MRRRASFLLSVLFCCVPVGAGSPQRLPISASVYADEAFQNFYNLELEEAVASYKKAIALEPENPLHYYGLADAYLFTHLLKAGKLDSRLYSTANEFLTAEKIQPDAASVKAMWEALGHARAICEKRLAANPRDVDAHYALGLTYAVEANYYFNMTRQYYDSLKAGTKAKDQHQKVLELDPANHDARLLIGLHEYAVGSVPASIRWVLYLAGYSGSKEKGVTLIQDALQHGKRTSPAALTILALIYNREKMYAYSRQMLGYLTKFFPRNFLYEMEIAASYRKENNLPAAIEVYKSVAGKMESHAPGYDRADAVKLNFQIASLLDQLHQSKEASLYYERVVSAWQGWPLPRPGQTAETDGGSRVASSPAGNRGAVLTVTSGPRLTPLVGQSFLRWGEICLAEGQREKARALLEIARATPYPEIQKQAAARLKSLAGK